MTPVDRSIGRRIVRNAHVIEPVHRAPVYCTLRSPVTPGHDKCVSRF